MGIGFYARDPVSLPHPPYPKATLQLIEKAIGEAWRIIRDKPEGDFNIQNANEDRITRELRTCLVNKVLGSGAVPGFTREAFHVTREAKFNSFDGTHLDKMPDLYIYVVRDDPVSLVSDDGLFVECKPVDQGHPAGRNYCNDGILRFVNGDYAWALSEALMIGYASPGYTLPNKLTDALAERKIALKTAGNVRKCPESSASDYCQHPHITDHERGFIYPSTKREAPKITLRHLWLNRY